MATPAHEVYDLLLDCATVGLPVADLLLGRHYTLCRANAVGLAMSAAPAGWSAPWSGPLRGRPVSELAGWIRAWDRQQAAVGMAAINAALNTEADMVYEDGALVQGSGALAAAFEWFRPRIGDARVVTVGRLPGLENIGDGNTVSVLPERDGALDPAAEMLLPKADWVFLADHCLPDKTFPRLMELARGATVVLMGAAVPWLDELAEMGVDYLVGTEVSAGDDLFHCVAEGAGLDGLAPALRYRIAPLAPRAATWRPPVRATVNRAAAL